MAKPDLDFVVACAGAAGEAVMRHFGGLERVEKKGWRDLVTAADRESEALITERIREHFPDHAVLAEEGAASQGLARHLWIVDPLDGTTNFVHRIPHFAVSIAWYEDGEPALACVLNPLLQECFTAVRGGGAFLAGRPLRCSPQPELSECVLGTGFHYERERKADSNLQHFVDFAFRVRGLRRLGSAALDLCYTADGRLDGFWELHLAPWDVAAGALVAREAGCAVTDLKGGPDWLYGGGIVAGNPALAATIRSVLAAADPALLPGPRYRPSGGPAS